MLQAEVEAQFQAAAVSHAAGDSRGAESLYRSVLAAQPAHAGALHGLGLLAAQVGLPDAAEPLLKQAITLEPDRGEWVYQFALVLLQSNKPGEAVVALRHVIDLEPQFPDAHNTLGVVFKQTGDIDRAIASYQKALSLNPGFPEAANNLGVALLERGLTGEAVDALERAVAARSDYPEALGNLGIALRSVKRTREAISALRRAAELRPDSPEFHYNLGTALQDGGRADEALEEYRRALSLRPDYVEALNNLGNVLHEKGDFDGAVDAYRRALALRPELADAHNNLGRALKEAGRLEEAIAAYQRAISLRSDFPDARANLGNALVQTGDVDGAISEYGRAVASPAVANDSAEEPPQLLDARWNLALALLLRGEFERGWEWYEVRNRKNAQAIGPELVNRFWDGSDLNGRRILLLGEQGLGDTIHFVRYAPMVAARGGRVLLHCQPALRRLMEGQSGIPEVVQSDSLPAFDVCCPLMSLPRLFKTTAEAIPANVPYVVPDPARVSHWAERLPPLSTGPRVGLVWAGNPGYGNDRIRSVSLSAMSPLAQVRGVTFVSLQKGDPAVQTRTPPPGMTVVDFSGDLTDFAETAALVANLDLVISVDTAVAHLSGAMGKRVWTLLPFAPDWRWQLGRSDSPWYPTMRLFRQPTRGDWPAVIREVEAALRSITA